MTHHLDAFIAKIETRDKLTPAEREAIRSMPQRVVKTAARARIVEEGEKPTQCCMVLEGIVYRTKTAANGQRQIMSFHVPGDMVDLHTVLFKIADHTIETARGTQVVLIPHEAVLKVAEDFPAVGRAFWFDTLVEASMLRETLLNIGRRDARTRAAHLFCELAVRLKRVGIIHNGAAFSLPLTQVELADALSITPIHMNRVLARFRKEGLVSTDSRTLTLHDWKAMAAIGEFDATYLHLEGPDDLHL